MIVFLKYLTHNHDLYIKQKLLENAIGGGNLTILAKEFKKWEIKIKKNTKVYQKWENVCHFGLGFARTMVAN